MLNKIISKAKWMYMYQLIKVPNFLSFLSTFHYYIFSIFNIYSVFLNFRLLCDGPLVFISKNVRNSAGQANIYKERMKFFAQLLLLLF